MRKTIVFIALLVVFASAIESVHAEVERLEGLRELLEYSELEWSEQQREIDRFQAEMERVRQRHLKRLQRFRRIRNGFREIESQESFRAENAQSELLELRSQLNDAVAMLESARDEKFLLEDQQKTELELLAAQRQEAEARCGQLSKQLEEACVQAMELESHLAVAKATSASSLSSVSSSSTTGGEAAVLVSPTWLDDGLLSKVPFIQLPLALVPSIIYKVPKP